MTTRQAASRGTVADASAGRARRPFRKGGRRADAPWLAGPKLPAPLLLGAVVLAGSGFAAACTPTPPAVKCTAIVSAARPVQGTNETITVKSVSGAKILTEALFRTISVSKTATTNALGFGQTNYNVGGAAPGFPVKVAVQVAKGGQKGTCSSSFTPASKVGLPPPPAPLPGAPTVTRTAEIVGKVGVAWAEADGHGLPITGWKVSRDGVDSDGTGAWSTVLPASANQFLFQSLIPGNSYTVSVAAVTKAGVGPATSRTVTDSTVDPVFDTPCPAVGVTTTVGYGVCDGFEFIPWLDIAIYNVSAQRQNGGVLVTYTADSAPGHYMNLPLAPAQITINGSLSQLGAATHTFNDPIVVDGPVLKHQFIPGSFATGRATFTVNGAAPGHGFTESSSEVIGVDIP